MAVVLKGLSESCTPVSINTANMGYNITSAEFKSRLGRFEETETMRAAESSDRVMKSQGQVTISTLQDQPSRMQARA